MKCINHALKWHLAKLYRENLYTFFFNFLLNCVQFWKVCCVRTAIRINSFFPLISLVCHKLNLQLELFKLSYCSTVVKIKKITILWKLLIGKRFLYKFVNTPTRQSCPQFLIINAVCESFKRSRHSVINTV